MVQDVIVLVLLVAVVSKVVYQATKYFYPKKGVVQGCGGCSECEIKKTLTSHAR